MRLIAEAIAGSAPSGASGVTTLDHETLDYPVKHGAVIERPRALTLGVVLGIVLAALGEAHEVRHGLRGVVREEGDEDVTLTGVQDDLRLVCRGFSHRTILPDCLVGER
jgi:hypothetical protein